MHSCKLISHAKDSFITPSYIELVVKNIHPFARRTPMRDLQNHHGTFHTKRTWHDKGEAPFPHSPYLGASLVRGGLGLVLSSAQVVLGGVGCRASVVLSGTGQLTSLVLRCLCVLAGLVLRSLGLCKQEDPISAKYPTQVQDPRPLGSHQRVSGIRHTTDGGHYYGKMFATIINITMQRAMQASQSVRNVTVTRSKTLDGGQHIYPARCINFITPCYIKQQDVRGIEGVVLTVPRTVSLADPRASEAFCWAAPTASLAESMYDLSEDIVK